MRQQPWLVLALVLLASCGPSGDGDGSSSDDTAGGEDEFDDTEAAPGDTVHASARELIGINPPDTPWSQMDHEARENDMIGRFHPIFREFFVEHDAEEFADFGCADCHGEDASERDFEMPNPHLPPVPPPDTEAYTALHAEHPDMMEFMEAEVTPSMQTMLGMGATFTCNGCHPTP